MSLPLLSLRSHRWISSGLTHLRAGRHLPLTDSAPWTASSEGSLPLGLPGIKQRTAEEHSGENPAGPVTHLPRSPALQKSWSIWRQAKETSQIIIPSMRKCPCLPHSSLQLFAALPLRGPGWCMFAFLCYVERCIFFFFFFFFPFLFDTDQNLSMISLHSGLSCLFSKLPTPSFMYTCVCHTAVGQPLALNLPAFLGSKSQTRASLVLPFFLFLVVAEIYTLPTLFLFFSSS